ncbi:polyprenyl synthetase family protein [Paraliomyxa miuraensis]|nr:polyprenyl synthetase family protein [Paraliomyxa miuraensis]
MFEQAFACVVPTDEPRSTSKLHQAMRHAAQNGGKRIRPRLLLATAVAANGGALNEDMAELTIRAAMAVELIHAASLVHDDLPCFDDADLRRGQPTVHRAYGEALALLTGDALITLAFETLAGYDGLRQRHAMRIVRMLSQATGSSRGIIGGQSLELAGPTAWNVRAIDFVEDYHAKKTAALFDYATRAAAMAVGVDATEQERWGDVGLKLGLAFQLIDDLYDIHASEEETGKTTGRDRALQRPNGAIIEGSQGAVKRLSELIDQACEGVFGVARKAEPVLRLLQSFDTLLCGLDVGESSLSATESGIFSSRVLAMGVA